MPRKNNNTSGMQDMFEQAKSDIIAQIDAQIHAKQSEIDFYEHSENNYDNGQGDAEDRLYVMTLRNEIRELENQRAIKISELTVNEK